jgi:hypothetical protein
VFWFWFLRVLGWGMQGRITDHEIPPFETGQEGRVRIYVENTGSSLSGQYSVSINTCTNGTEDRTCSQDSDCGGGIKCTDRSAGGKT